MKKQTTKTIATFLLILNLFTMTAFADGDGGTPIGGRTCGGTDQPPCEIAPPASESPFIKTVKEYLILIFG